MGLFGTTFAVIAIVGFLAILLAFIKEFIEKRQQAKELEKQEEEEKRKREELLLSLKSGQWEFPSREFYALCVEKGIKQLDDKFYLQKARLLAEEILWNHRIPNTYIPRYCSDDHLTKAFNEAKKALEKENTEKEELERKRREEWNRTPHRGDPNKDEERAMTLAMRASMLTGTQKRKMLLEDSLSLIQEKVRETEDQQEAFRILGSAISNAAFQEKPKDWATAGGIASAIAGPAAGIAVATSVIEENKAIAARNEANRNAVMALGSNIGSLAAGSTTTLSQMEKSISRIREEINALKEKVVLNDVGGETLGDLMAITSYKIVKQNNNILKVTLALKNNYIFDAPEGIRIVVDGMYVVEIFVDDLCLGVVNIPLPLYGVECGKTAEIVGYCPKYMAKECNYSIKIRSCKLWAMEL